MTIKSIAERVEQYKEVHEMLACDLALAVAKDIFATVPSRILKCTDVDDLAEMIQKLLNKHHHLVSNAVFEEYICWDIATYNSKIYLRISSWSDRQTDWASIIEWDYDICINSKEHSFAGDGLWRNNIEVVNAHE